MKKDEQQTLTAKNKGFTTELTGPVTRSYLNSSQDFPLVLSPGETTLNPSLWASQNQASVKAELLAHGAVLFRDFAVGSVREFEQFALGLYPQLNAEFVDFPPDEGGEKIFQVTPYSAHKSIRFHNESGHIFRWPSCLFFYCVRPADEGGETPLVNGRKLVESLGPELASRFEEKGLMYSRNFYRDFDASWQEVFKTDEKTEVEAYCRKAGMRFEWRNGDELHTRFNNPAIIGHPDSGEPCFFNQILLFHRAVRDPEVQHAWLSHFKEEDLPRNVYFGDGSPIPDDTVSAISRMYQNQSAAFRWRKGDILLIDNMLMAHGRNPYKGPRKIVVAMGPLLGHRDLAVQGSPLEPVS